MTEIGQEGKEDGKKMESSDPRGKSVETSKPNFRLLKINAYDAMLEIHCMTLLPYSY